MTRKTLSYLVPPVLAAVALLVWAEPAAAQRGGSRGGGGFRGGGLHAGGFRGGVGGYHYGQHPYYGYRGYQPYYHGYHAYPYYGYGYYPYYYGNYGSGLYSDSGSGYAPYSSAYSPLGSEEANAPTSSAQAPDPDTANKFLPAAPAGSTNGTVGNSAAGPVHITVRLPGDADLWFDTTKTTETGPVRVFTTPPLAPGQKYTYEVHARWIDNDTTRDQKQTIVFAPGDNPEVSFPVPEGTGEKAKGTSTPEGAR